MEKGLFVVAEAVEEIENGEAAGFVGVEAGRKKDAIGDGMREDFAWYGVAFDAAGGSGRWEVKEVKEGKEVKDTKKSPRRRRRSPWEQVARIHADILLITAVRAGGNS